MLSLSIHTVPWATRQTFSRFSCSVVLLLPRGSLADRGSTGVAFLFSPGVETFSRGDGNIDRGEGATLNSMIALKLIAHNPLSRTGRRILIFFSSCFSFFFSFLFGFLVFLKSKKKKKRMTFIYLVFSFRLVVS